MARTVADQDQHRLATFDSALVVAGGTLNSVEQQQNGEIQMTKNEYTKCCDNPFRRCCHARVRSRRSGRAGAGRPRSFGNPS
jgi:hypothetical protein